MSEDLRRFLLRLDAALNYENYDAFRFELQMAVRALLEGDVDIDAKSS